MLAQSKENKDLIKKEVLKILVLLGILVVLLVLM